MTEIPDVRATTPTSLSGLRAGAEVGGYRLVRRLGAGGMGVVWEVSDGDGLHVAMKILHPQIAADPMARRRLDREASVLARVRDARVARILDIETGDGADGTGVTFVITELVDGPTLQHEVDHEGAYDLSEDARDLADLAHGLVDALKAVHAAGVIHRDLKPSNVMLGAQGPVLIDFGIAQVADDVRLTQTGQVTGTPGFIPPEMLDGGEPSPGVDWYACAGVLLFAVTGRAPFGSGPWQAVFRRVYGGTPELGGLETACPALSRAFAAALAPEEGDRLSMDDLLTVLDEVADGGSGEAALARALGDSATTSSYGSSYGSAAYGAASPYGSTSVASAAGVSPVNPVSAMSPGSRPVPVTGPASSRSYGYLSAPTGARAAVVPDPRAYAQSRSVELPEQDRRGEKAFVLPGWAREPRPHRLVVASIALLLAVLGVWVPTWSVLVAAVLIVVAGTVGRADDARRVGRLEAGRAGRGDTARMVALSPVYLLRSVAASAAAVLVGGIVAVLLAVGGAVVGLDLTALPGVVQGLSEYHRAGAFSAALVAVFLAVAWFVPWGLPTRRGGRRLIETFTHSASPRLILVMVLLSAALGVVGLFALGAMPPTTLAPLTP
ncbi:MULTISPECIES: serine/threonine-protein kinase [Actinomyces]|uniref:Protein kinase n=1 Tax=Actinomyces respiraculi TaxID=2744574 RepID=A0A7T0LKV2_9ACTO|nr:MULTISPECIES: serine/threonine-protein kinase [Actinomyces]QPL05617.1 protein kinase [Actinomyces respiraculi]